MNKYTGKFKIMNFFAKINIANTTYITLCGQVGLHGHGMFDHQLGPDLAEQVQGGDTCHQPCWIDTFTFYKARGKIQIKPNSILILSDCTKLDVYFNWIC